jgi:hypothetical protein
MVGDQINGIANFHFFEEKGIVGQGFPPSEGEEPWPGGLLELAKRFRQPAGAGDVFFRFSGQILFLQGFQLFINRSSGRFLDCLNDLFFFDTAKVVGGRGLPPIGHIEF